MENLITKEYQGMPFVFREDGYFNMTKAAEKFGKRLDKFFSTDETREYIEALDSISNTTERGELIQTRRGNGGTWAHPKLAIRFVQWLDVRFAVWCDSIIEDILTKKADLTITKPQESATVAASQAGFGLESAVYVVVFLWESPR
ncbi:KilA-N domain-containing protein [Vogesella sp. LYT5W]|uniref:KilA-N domain-containing protein n=1 Tax=Vogesella margarita TaxID=2984199 RepID=A0ABT5IP99_9NEIS|nr:KilA-N domain-containing protein [Vogesella margarita]MDC7713464.1 KilA-N domain-containing protein [Vogesella margarita]